MRRSCVLFGLAIALCSAFISAFGIPQFPFFVDGDSHTAYGNGYVGVHFYTSWDYDGNGLTYFYVGSGESWSEWTGSTPQTYCDSISVSNRWTFSGTGLTITCPAGYTKSGYSVIYGITDWSGTDEVSLPYGAVKASFTPSAGGAVTRITQRVSAQCYFESTGDYVHATVTKSVS